MGLLGRLRGDRTDVESRALTRDNIPPSMLPYSRTALLDVNQSNALRVADAFACVQLISNAIAGLPAKVYRKTPTGRMLAGDDQRLVQLLRRPSPGSTASDLFRQILVSLLVTGDASSGSSGPPTTRSCNSRFSAATASRSSCAARRSSTASTARPSTGPPTSCMSRP